MPDLPIRSLGVISLPASEVQPATLRIPGGFQVLLKPKAAVLPLSVSLGGRAPTSGSSAGFEFTQGSPATTWTINHNLGHHPVVSVFTSGGVEVEASVVHTSFSQTLVQFNSAMSGYAVCQ